MKYILSRAYVEFGPFEAEEIVGFIRRGLFRDGDFLRSEHSHHWDPWEVWIHHYNSPTTAAKKEAAPAKKVIAKKAAIKKVATKKAPTKKAAAKKVTKKKA